MVDMGFSLKTERFEGPLELLIELIEKRKMLVNDISLANVTDEYIAYVAGLEKYSLTRASKFIALAATLLLIKSKSLLPVFEMTKEEESSVSQLENKLKVYQVFRDAGKVIERRFGVSPLYSRRITQDSEPVFVTDSYTTQAALRDAIGRLFASLPEKESVPQVRVKKTISLEEMVDTFRKRIGERARLRFDHVIGKNTEKVTRIVGFLAVLELARQGEVLVHQEGYLGEIEVERECVQSIPRFG